MGKTTKKLTLSAMFLAIGMVLPFLTGQIPQVGNMMLPMHIPVLLCGLICGWQYGAVPGIIIQLVLIPTVMVALGRTGLVHFHTHRKEEAAE